MLKRLELIGFKSFADRTRFDFARGITAVVGPNGSGKSNVVDAVKWILGEQSAKSLRGGEMADVIFNGSSTRKSLGLAEVTMTFDNTKRQLQFDGDEVQITRRVYRDGQGEYLINQQTARLKDIKEMFLGSGAGHGAYSIIEQGRVDALLIASTKDRRQIFEEAAGISRFKAKKTEALRKLEATELNLNRVKDILQELEKALRTLSSQAAKAQKYQEHQAELKRLRIGLALHEFAELADTLAYEEDLLTKLRAELGDATGKIESGEQAIAKLDWDLARNDETLRVQEKKLGEARQQIAEQEAMAKSRREQAANLTAESLRLGTQRTDLFKRLQGLKQEREAVLRDAATANAAAEAESHRAAAAVSALAVVAATIGELARQAQAARDEQFALVGRAAQLRSTADMTASQVERLNKELLRKRAESERVGAEAAAIERVLAGLSEDSSNLQHQLADAKAALDSLRQQQSDLRHRSDHLQPQLDALRDRRGDLRGRADVLEQLERSQEGLGAGVKAVLEKKKSDAVLGLVADLLNVPQAIAPLIDIVLGETAQRFVVKAGTDLESLIATFGELPGRVGFIPLASAKLNLHTQAPDDLPPINVDAPLEPTSLDAVTSRLPGLVEQLLGNVRIVDDLADAGRHPGLRCITRRGELLEPDGTLVAGPLHGGTGILSRKSELREVKLQLAALDADVTALEQQQAKLRHEADALVAPITGREAETAALTGKAGDLRDRLAQQREKQARLADLADLTAKEAGILAGEAQKADAALTATTAEAAAAESAAHAMKDRLSDTEQQLKLAEVTRDERQKENTAAQVALSNAKQAAAALATKQRDLEAEFKTRTAEANAIATAEADAQSRLTECELIALRATASAAEAYGEKESRAAQAADLMTKRDLLRAQRDAVQEEIKAVRDAWKQRQDQAHAHDLTVRDLLNRRIGIETRIREDYDVEFAQIPAGEMRLEAGFDEDDVQGEIDDLKKKIAKLGSVNLEALEQLAVEEAREKKLRGEFDDLANAEKALLEIIETINADSRRLFAETLATVKGHFQDLFRKLFGGGMADIILENPADILESGIEIAARPPGKELRSISLLSGGEKTMTAVALLLAIFRSRPSPFCLLDEVDAALDEANTARLAAVLREFLDQSQFIIITHKKRTMAMADVLYGITMQESGVSKQVATRIDDWPDDDVQAAA